MSEELKIFIEKIKTVPDPDLLDEANTKQTVILPILQCLNWNTYDANEVRAEYFIQFYHDRVDYCLRINNYNKVFIEVKKIADSLKEQTQLCDYANHEDVKLAIFTNGLRWEFFLPRHAGTWKQRKFYTIDIQEQNTIDVVTKFFEFLEKSNVENGISLKNAENALEGQKREKTIAETLPKAWDKIISEPDIQLLDLLANTTEKICSYKPDTEHLKKFLASVGDNSFKREEQQFPKRSNGHLYQTVKGEGDLVCEGKRAGVHASGRQSSDGFWVLKGSTAILSETKSMPPSAKKIRANLKKEGILRVVGNFYEFTSDFCFNSPSAAAGVVLARSANGKAEWKNLSKV